MGMTVTNAREDAEKGNLCTLLVGMGIRTAATENSVEIPKPLDTELPYDPAVPLGIYPRDVGASYQSRSTKLTAALFTIPKTWNLPRCLQSEEWIFLKCAIYTQFSAVKNGILSFEAE